MSDIASHPDPEADRVVRRLFRNVGVPNIANAVYDCGPVRRNLRAVGIEAARQIHIQITWH